ncbi:hypothetical protein ACVXZZ_17400 [Staphylococcus aureus]
MKKKDKELNYTLKLFNDQSLKVAIEEALCMLVIIWDVRLATI